MQLNCASVIVQVKFDTPNQKKMEIGIVKITKAKLVIV